MNGLHVHVLLGLFLDPEDATRSYETSVGLEPTTRRYIQQVELVLRDLTADATRMELFLVTGVTTSSLTTGLNCC